jgi:hypothetical protein
MVCMHRVLGVRSLYRSLSCWRDFSAIGNKGARTTESAEAEKPRRFYDFPVTVIDGFNARSSAGGKWGGTRSTNSAHARFTAYHRHLRR